MVVWKYRVWGFSRDDDCKSLDPEEVEERLSEAASDGFELFSFHVEPNGDAIAILRRRCDLNEE